MATKTSTKTTTVKAKTPSKTTATKAASSKKEVSPEAIQQRAQEIYLERMHSGRQGDQLSDWLEVV